LTGFARGSRQRLLKIREIPELTPPKTGRNTPYFRSNTNKDYRKLGSNLTASSHPLYVPIKMPFLDPFGIY